MSEIKAVLVSTYEGLGDGDGFVPVRYWYSNGKLHLMILPCLHAFRPDGRWEERDVDDQDKITLTPSIFCSPSVPCWHGYLTKGVFKN